MCFPVTAFSLLPSVSLPCSSKCSHCHSSPCQMLERDPSYKKRKLFSVYTNICICTVQTANSKSVSSGFNRIYIFFKSHSSSRAEVCAFRRSYTWHFPTLKITVNKPLKIWGLTEKIILGFCTRNIICNANMVIFSCYKQVAKILPHVIFHHHVTNISAVVAHLLKKAEFHTVLHFNIKKHLCQ